MVKKINNICCLENLNPDIKLVILSEPQIFDNICFEFYSILNKNSNIQRYRIWKLENCNLQMESLIAKIYNDYYEEYHGNNSGYTFSNYLNDIMNNQNGLNL